MAVWEFAWKGDEGSCVVEIKRWMFQVWFLMICSLEVQDKQGYCTQIYRHRRNTVQLPISPYPPTEGNR